MATSAGHMITATIFFYVFPALGTFTDTKTWTKLEFISFEREAYLRWLASVLPLIFAQEAHHGVKAYVAKAHALRAFYLKLR
mmetsp:Transcript_25328/g.55292  ORF Transcript_25328/g.55292 Transcript_25328/m.55292 type:complete len:82 (-) Transcript_25328:1269-1514(-)